MSMALIKYLACSPVLVKVTRYAGQKSILHQTVYDGKRYLCPERAREIFEQRKSLLIYKAFADIGW